MTTMMSHTKVLSPAAAAAISGVPECRYKLLTSTLATKGVCKTPLPENHIDNQQSATLNIFRDSDSIMRV